MNSKNGNNNNIMNGARAVKMSPLFGVFEFVANVIPVFYDVLSEKLSSLNCHLTRFTRKRSNFV